MQGLVVAALTCLVLLLGAGGPPPASAQDHGDHSAQGAASPDPHAGHRPPPSAATLYRSVPVIATDSAFSVKLIRVRRGETVRIVIRNESKFFVHEFTIGSRDVLREHRRTMLRMVEAGTLQTPGARAAMHQHGNSVLVDPGEEKEIVWTFPGDARIEFGCTIPGHYEAGMRGVFAYRPLLLRREDRS